MIYPDDSANTPADPAVLAGEPQPSHDGAGA